MPACGLNKCLWDCHLDDGESGGFGRPRLFLGMWLYTAPACCCLGERKDTGKLWPKFKEVGGVNGRGVFAIGGMFTDVDSGVDCSGVECPGNPSSETSTVIISPDDCCDSTSVIETSSLFSICCDGMSLSMLEDSHVASEI